MSNYDKYGDFSDDNVRRAQNGNSRAGSERENRKRDLEADSDKGAELSSAKGSKDESEVTAAEDIE